MERNFNKLSNISGLIYLNDRSVYFNLKRISIVVIIAISFIIALGRMYCFYDEAYVAYDKYKGLSAEEIHSVFNNTGFAESLKEKIAPDENVLVVKKDPAALFLSYYIYPRKIFKYKNTGYKESPETFEEIPPEWIKEHEIDWVVWDCEESQVKRLKR